jgi:hypothetical protein
MLWVWLAVGLATVVLGAGVILSATDSLDTRVFWGGALGLVGFIVAAVFGAMLISQHYDRVSCHTFAQNTRRETRFVHYTAYSWDCLTRTKGDKWIPTKNLREFGEQP